jgi:hypothetical protein
VDAQKSKIQSAFTDLKQDKFAMYIEAGKWGAKVPTSGGADTNNFLLFLVYEKSEKFRRTYLAKYFSSSDKANFITKRSNGAKGAFYQETDRQTKVQNITFKKALKTC